MDSFSFKVREQDKQSRARLGVISTPHGKVETPAFVPVGTLGTVKTLTPDELNTLGVQLFFVNTYHMYLRPGVAVIKKFGGLHRFMGWNGPIITDSGGFQIFSLARVQNNNGALRGASFAAHPSSVGSLRVTGAGGPPRRGPLVGVLGGKPPAGPAGSFLRVTGFEKTRLAAPDEYPPQIVKITDEGVEFRSHWDGSLHQFTPEKSIKIQQALGADMILAFDDCTPYPATHQQARFSLSRTHRWAARSLSAREKLRRPSQALYGVIQGSVYEDLRHESAKFISSMNFAGIAIGGVSVGESKAEMQKVLEWVTPLLPEDKPRHLLGVGEIDDIFTLVEQGIDTFDCVQPTRLARTGKVFTRKTKQYQIDILNKKFSADTKPIEPDCQCYTCRHFSRAYLHHLFRVRELLAYRLATIHNLYFVQDLLQQIRRAIRAGKFLELKKQWLYNE